MDRARELEKAGARAESLEEYLAWVEEHPRDQRVGEVVAHLVSVSRTTAERRDVLERLAAAGANAEVRREILVDLARALEAGGDLEGAQERYLEASFAVPGKKDFESLYASGVLLVELGELRGAEAQMRALMETADDPALVTQAMIAASRILYMSGDEEGAWRLIAGGEASITDRLPPQGLYWMYELGRRTERLVAAERARKALSERYPQSIEHHLSLGTVSVLPSASLALGLGGLPASRPTETAAVDGVRGDDAPPAVSTAVEDSAPRFAGIQTGSYSVRENAEYAVRDLSAAGFSAKISERTVAGALFYRVIVADVEPFELRMTLTRLKEKGFEGFALYEK